MSFQSFGKDAFPPPPKKTSKEMLRRTGGVFSHLVAKRGGGGGGGGEGGLAHVPLSIPLLAAAGAGAIRFASKKAGGSTANGRDSNPKFLGIKKYGGELVRPGHIIARQRGTKWHPGENCGIGTDHTLYSLVDGKVKFTKNRVKGRTIVNVEKFTEEEIQFWQRRGKLRHIQS